MQAKASGGSGNLPAFLQDTRAQIAIGVVALLAIVFLVWNLTGGFGSASTATSVPLSNTPSPDSAGYPGAAGATPATDAPTPAAGAAASAAAGAAAKPSATATPKEGAKDAAGPKPPSRANPFVPNTELKKVEASIPKPPEFFAYPASQNIYVELRKPRKPVGVSDGQDEGDGPPVPPMRLAGIIQGSDRLSAMLQMGSQFLSVTPGQKVPDRTMGPFRVDSIEPTRITLSRSWEEGDHKGVQHVEVPLSDGVRTAPAYTAPTGGAGYPGAGGGGYPGSGGGYPGRGGGGYPGR